jgi:Flp pilus assembly pilin Flp
VEKIKRGRTCLGRQGFLSLEYALLIALVVAALVGMALYFQRSLSGKWREAGDSFGFGRQYSK